MENEVLKFCFWPQKREVSIRRHPSVPLVSWKTGFRCPKWPIKVLAKNWEKLVLLTFLLTKPSILIQFSSVIPFWKAEGLTIVLVVWKNFKSFQPMRKMHLKIGYQGCYNFWFLPPMKKMFLQKSLIFSRYFWI